MLFHNFYCKVHEIDEKYNEKFQNFSPIQVHNSQRHFQ